MIVRVLPISVPHMWSLVRPGVKGTMARISKAPDKATAEILKRCCAGVMQLWFVGNPDNGDLRGFILTELSTDMISGSKSLHIYMLHLLKEVNKELIEEAKTVLNTFAREHNCTWLTFLAEEVRMAVAAERWWPGWEVRPLARRSVT